MFSGHYECLSRQTLEKVFPDTYSDKLTTEVGVGVCMDKIDNDSRRRIVSKCSAYSDHTCQVERGKLGASHSRLRVHNYQNWLEIVDLNSRG